MTIKSFRLHSYTQQQQRAFAVFYDTYASWLWGFIQAANLPAAQAETILMNTLTKAWQHHDAPKKDKQYFSRLMSLACG